MPYNPCRIVLDTNVVLRGLINPDSSAGKVLSACETRRVVPLINKPLLDEYRYVLTDPALATRYRQLESRRVEVALARLSFIGDRIRAVNVRFSYPRDPTDAKLIELAIAGKATHLITCDADLLDLASGRDEPAKRFRQRLPTIKVLNPRDLIQLLGHEIGIP